MRRIRDFPKKLTIGDWEWRVVWKRRIIDEGVPCLGLCDSSTRTIYIKLGQSPEERLSTLLHEVLHAIEFSLGMDVGHKVINAIEGPLARLLLENFWVAAIKWEEAS